MNSAAHPRRFIENASDIASYYGFRPLRELNPELFRKDVGRRVPSFTSAALYCAHCVASRESEVMLAYWATPVPTHTPEGISVREAAEFSLQVIGCPRSTAEIVVLKTLAAILEGTQARLARVAVNAWGDRESRERFARELSAFVRRRLGSRVPMLEENERVDILENPFALYSSTAEPVRELLAEAPRSLHFLSEKSRLHFKELLDYLEQVGLPYELNDRLGGDAREPRVMFRIELEDENSFVLGSAGGRYDEHVSKLSGRRELSVVHASIYFRKKGADRSSFFHAKDLVPKLYFIQLGLRAKLRGLSVIDMLRQANIPVAQTFDANKLSPQLAAAATLGVGHVLIMGEREALDGTIIIRSMRNSSQQIIELSHLPRHLRTLRG